MKRLSLRRLWDRALGYNPKGITGIETAIILIAFVVVAAVFAYVVISAGMYSTQKSQESIYKGLKEAQGALCLKGGIVGMADNIGATGNIKQLTFTLTMEMGGEPIDFTNPDANLTNDGMAGGLHPNKVVISYIDAYQKVDDLYWTSQFCGHTDGDQLLDEGEMVQVTIGSADATLNGGNLEDALTSHTLGVATKFALQVTTPIGSTLIVERTTPNTIDAVMNLY
jgi:flagellin FlaB